MTKRNQPRLNSKRVISEMEGILVIVLHLLVLRNFQKWLVISLQENKKFMWIYSKLITYLILKTKSILNNKFRNVALPITELLINQSENANLSNEFKQLILITYKFQITSVIITKMLKSSGQNSLSSKIPYKVLIYQLNQFNQIREG